MARTVTKSITTITVLLVLLTLKQSSSQHVTTSNGDIRGSRLTHLNKHVDVYCGIPYAKPPIGELRFKYPQPSDPWTLLDLDLHTPPPSCLQPRNISSFPEKYRQIFPNFSEDCLYLNIWTPVDHHNLSVLVWMHGGRFREGSSVLPLYNGQFMSGESDVVVVSFNYRLGPLGFSYLGPDTIPGNMGLMDQVLALQWVKENIVHFGGDPSKITLFGQDSGAVSVGLHLLSPLSRDLFDKAILQSGTPTAYWSYNVQTTARKYVMKLGNILNCSEVTDQELMVCLQEADPKQLIESQMLIMTSGLPFLPVVDGVFLPDIPSSLLNSGKFKNTSILHGVVQNEASRLLYHMLDMSSPDFTLAYNRYNLLLENYLKGVNDKLQPEATTLYYENAQELSTTPNYLNILSDIRSDVDYKCPALDFGSYFAQYNPTYLYSFNHKISKSSYPAWVGATHGYELEMVFGLPINVSLGFKQPEQQLSWFMMTYWTNFAKSGDPNTPIPVAMNWLPYDNINKSYLSLDVDGNIGNKQGLRHRECGFISQILPLIPANDDDMRNLSCLEEVAQKCPGISHLLDNSLLPTQNAEDLDDNSCTSHQAPIALVGLFVVFVTAF